MNDHVGKRPGSRSLIEDAVEPSAQRAPGKRTLVEDVDAGVHAAARTGTSGPGGPLPFGATIQRAFGRHDIAHVQAHIGGAAAEGAEAMGAEAFATGDRVAFARQPSLHTAAHEAAHVVQQRAGVQLKGGVGQVGDAYERHADAVADRVVSGQSAEALLDEMAGGGSTGAAAVQRKVGFELEVNWSVKRDAVTDQEKAREADERAAFEATKQQTRTAAYQQAQDQKDQEYEAIRKAFCATKKYKDFVAKYGEGSSAAEPATGTISESDLRAEFPEFAQELDLRNQGAKPRDRVTMVDAMPPYLSGMIARKKAKRLSSLFGSKQRRYTVHRPNEEFYKVDPNAALVRNQNDNAALEEFIPGISLPKAKVLMSGPLHDDAAPQSRPEAPGAGVVGTIVRTPLWNLTADQSSGVSELEWVTRPLETRAQVETAMSEMTRMGQQLNSLAAALGAAPAIPAERLEQDGVTIVPELRNAGLKIYPDSTRKLLADPQFTGGFRLDQLATVMESLTQATVTTREDGTGAAREHSTARYLGKLTQPESEALGKALRAARAAQGTERIGGNPLSEALVSFLAMILNYLYVGERRVENSKGIAAGFMARTDFAHNFSLLPASEQEHFRAHQGSFSALIGRISGLDMTGKVYAQGFQREASRTDEVFDYPLTRQDWCDGIVGGTDLLRKSVDADDPEKGIRKDPINKPFLQDPDGTQRPDPVHYSLGRLGSVDDTVGPDRVRVAVVELRRMTGSLPVESWTEFALAAFDLVQTMNAAKQK